MRDCAQFLVVSSGVLRWPPPAFPGPYMVLLHVVLSWWPRTLTGWRNPHARAAAAPRAAPPPCRLGRSGVLICIGSNPCVHGAAVVQEKMYVFGGNYNGRYLGDIACAFTSDARVFRIYDRRAPSVSKSHPFARHAVRASTSCRAGSSDASGRGCDASVSAVSW